MPIQPKFSIKKQPQTAQRFFTDRTEPRTLFDKRLSDFDPQEQLVLNFYGIGGIGKTRLTKELINKISSINNWSSALLDMEQISFHDSGAALIELRNQIRKNNPKCKFTSFDFAYAIYWQRLNPKIDLSEKGLETIENSDLINDILNGFIDGIDIIPGVNVITKIAILAKKSNSALNKWWLKRGYEQLSTLETLPIPNIKEYLPAYFASDIKDFLNTKPNINLCFFIDTYEALWDKNTKSGQFFETDEWVRELISNLPEVLFVISGREKLRWEEVDLEWSNVIDSHILECLSKNDANLFLERCGINSTDIRDTIVESSEGSPFYLDLSIDSYNKILANNEIAKVDNFTGKTKRQILDRFVRYLNQSEFSTLKVLSLCRRYDSEIFSLLTKEFNTGYSLIDMPELNQYSFIHNIGLDEYTINPLMKRSLIDHLDLKLKNKINSFLFNHYRNDAKNFYQDSFSGFKSFEEARYYLTKVQLAPVQRLDFYMLSGKIYQYQCLMNQALQEFEKASSLNLCDIEKIQDARIEIAITLRQDNKLDDALIILKSIIPISVSHNLVNIEGKALVQQGLCLFSQANTNEQNNLYLVAYKLYQKGLVCAEKAGDLKQIIYTKITMSTVMEKLNKLNEACDLLHESQLLATEHNFHHLYIDCFNGLARKYLILKNYEKCIFFAEKGLKMWEKNNFFRGQLVMCCHILEAHFYLGSSSKEVLTILKKGTLLDGIVTEKLIKHMYQKASKLWVSTAINTQV